MKILFISDLHLSRERPEITELFLDFMRHQGRQTDELYILGDLFEVWIGDDAIEPEYKPVITALKAAADSGIHISFMHGNRDFLIGEAFARMAGCRILPDPSIIQLDGEPILLMHGDTLCTDDLDYQQFRARVRNPEVQREFLAQPAAKRAEIAGQYRLESRERSKHKAEEIMDVNQDAVISSMKQYHVRTLIHGHTHRPAIHTVEIDGQQARRIVLGDWYHHGSVLTYEDHHFDLQGFDRTNILTTTGG